MEKITAKTKVTATELAAVLGISARYIRQMVEDGKLQKDGGAFLLCQSVQAFVEIKKEDTSDETRNAEKKKLIAEAKLKESKAKIARMEAAELEGKMHRSEDVRACMEDLVYSIRSALLSLPGRIAVDAAACETAAEASEVIKREVYALMEEIAGYRYDPERYAERVRDRMKWESVMDDGEQ